MHTLTGRILAAVALCVLVFVPKNLAAHDDGRYANSPLKAWFDKLASGKGLCFSFADGVSVDIDLKGFSDDFYRRVVGARLRGGPGMYSRLPPARDLD